MYSPVHPNIELLECRVEDFMVIYEVDRFIFVDSDVSLFKQLLDKTNELYGYGKCKILFNGKEV